MFAGDTGAEEPGPQSLATAQDVHRLEPGARFLDVPIVALLVDARDQPRSQIRLRGVVGAEDWTDRRVLDRFRVESQDDIAAVVDADLAYAGVVPEVKTVFGKQAADLDLRADGPFGICLLYTSPSPRDATLSRMPSSA